MSIFAHMAKKKVYRCKQCGYSCDVYEGKGFYGQHITPVACPDCKTVQNIVVGGIIGEVAPSFSIEGGRLCPNCGSMEIHKWNMRTCPKCKGEMIDTGLDEFWV